MTINTVYTSPRTGTIDWHVWKGAVQPLQNEQSVTHRAGAIGHDIEILGQMAGPSVVMLLAYCANLTILEQTIASVQALKGQVVECVDGTLVLHHCLVNNMRILNKKRCPTGFAAQLGASLTPIQYRLEVEMELIKQPTPTN